MSEMISFMVMLMGYSLLMAHITLIPFAIITKYYRRQDIALTYKAGKGFVDVHTGSVLHWITSESVNSEVGCLSTFKVEGYICGKDGRPHMGRDD